MKTLIKMKNFGGDRAIPEPPILPLQDQGSKGLKPLIRDH